MGGKKGKKASKKQKKSEGGDEAGEDDNTPLLYQLYMKKSTALGVKAPAKVQEKFDDVLNEGMVLSEVFHMYCKTIIS